MAVEAKQTAAFLTYRTCTMVWVALIVLLVATIAIARLALLAQYSVLGSLTIATLKAGLVVTYFMHMKFENVRMRLMLLLALFVVAVIVGFTFIDVWYR